LEPTKVSASIDSTDALFAENVEQKIEQLPRRTIIPGIARRSSLAVEKFPISRGGSNPTSPPDRIRTPMCWSLSAVRRGWQRQFGQRPIQPGRADHSPVTTGRSASVLINPNIAVRDLVSGASAASCGPY
jgi:hypothetical protein